MDIKLLVVLVASSLSACAAFPYVKPFPVSNKAFVPGVFVPTEVLRIFNEQAEMLNQDDKIKDVKPATDKSPIKEEKPQIEEIPKKEQKPEVQVSKSSSLGVLDQESSVIKPEEQQQRPLQNYQNTINQQNPVDPSKPSENLSPNVQGNLQSQPQYTPNGLPYQGPGAVNYAQTPNPQPINQETWNNQKQKPEVQISKSSDQESSVFKPEEQQYRPLQSYQNTINQQNPVDPSKLSQNLSPNVQGNLQSQPQYTPNGLPYQRPDAVNYAQTPNPQPINQETWNNQAPNVYVQPNYNGQPTGYNPNTARQPPQNGYYQPQNVVVQQPNLYNQQPNLYSQQPNIYSQQPTNNQQPNGYYQQPAQYNQQPAYNQQPIVYSQQPNVYNPQPVFVGQPASNQQLFVPNSPNPKPSNPGVVLNANQNQPPLYAIVPINGNQNAIPGSNAYFIPVQQAQPNPALLVSSKAEED